MTRQLWILCTRDFGLLPRHAQHDLIVQIGDSASGQLRRELELPDKGTWACGGSASKEKDLCSQYLLLAADTAGLVASEGHGFVSYSRVLPCLEHAQKTYIKTTFWPHKISSESSLFFQFNIY